MNDDLKGPFLPGLRSLSADQARRIAREVAVILALFAVLLLGFCSAARAQSAMDFVQIAQRPSATPAVRGRFQRTGRVVTTALPVPPPPFIRGRLVCADNVNRFRAKLGLRTTNSRAAFSFRSLRPVGRDTPGAVQVSRRRGGGHAEIVAGGGKCWNPSAARQRWVLVACSARRNVIGWYV